MNRKERTDFRTKIDKSWDLQWSEGKGGDGADSEFLVGSVVDGALIDSQWPVIDQPSWFTSFPSLTFLSNFNSRTEVSFFSGLINTFFHSAGIEPTK